MLYKKMFSIVMTAAICGMFLCTSYVSATDSNTSVAEPILKITDIQYETIEKIIGYINKELKKIDDKIAMSRKLEEFDKYPAVRLNIDTPYFGMSSIIESKLKIRTDVSTVDMASGYSIRQVVNKKNMKLETFEVSNIVVITRDVNIDKEMTYADAQICIFKLLEYLDQSKSANNFLDKQLNSMISGYLVEEKTSNIIKINEKIVKLEDTLNSSLSELSYIYNVCEIDINEDIEKLYEYTNSINNIKTMTKSILVTKEILAQNIENLEKLEIEIKNFRFNVNKKYLEATNNLNLEKAVYLINSKMKLEVEYIKKYIDSSMTEVKEESIDKSLDNIVVKNSENLIYQEDKMYIENYKVTSKNMFDSMKNDFQKCEEILGKIVRNNLIIEDEVTKKEVFNNDEIINDISSIYISFLNKENIFLSDNSKINITETKKSHTLFINSISDIEYMYINLSDILTKISDDFKINSSISNVRTIDSLKEVIDNVLSCSKNLKTNIKK